MNALIDVTLVLLIFFILTAGYASLPKEIGAPPATTADLPDKPVEVDPKQIEEQMIRVDVNLVDGKPVIKVLGQVVAADRLENELTKRVKATKKTTLLLVADRNVPSGTVVEVLDAAQGAKIEQVKRAVGPAPPSEK